jgi:DNA polymerase III subunit epsilon
MSDHQIIKTDSGYQCTVCQWTYKSRPHIDGCPGVPRYEWGQAPKNLMTMGQLEKLKLHPGPDRRGVVVSTYGQYSLYDRNETNPWTTEEIAAKKVSDHHARYQACVKCGKEFRREKLDDDFGACKNCLPEVAKAYYENKRAKFLAMIDAARDRAILWSRDMLAHPEEWVILDTETTGLDSGDEVIQISLMNSAGDVLLDELVNPISEISEGAYEVHGISMEMLAGKPSIAVLAPRLAELLPGGMKIVAYNADFDCRLLWQSLSRNEAKGFDPFGYTWHDVMVVYAKFYGEWDDYHKDFRWQRLQGDHTAAGDCRATLALIRTMAAAELSSEKKPEPAA